MQRIRSIFARCFCAAIVVVGWSESLSRADVTLVFAEPDFDWFAGGGSATPYHIWTTGDFWAQNFTGTAQPSAGHMDLRLFIDDNTLSGGSQVNLNAVLNGTVVGGFTIPQGVTGLLNFSFNFPAIAGPNYDVRLLETNTVPLGLGAVSMAPNGQSTVTLTPEPATGLTATGAAALLLWRRQRR